MTIDNLIKFLPQLTPSIVRHVIHLQLSGNEKEQDPILDYKIGQLGLGYLLDQVVNLNSCLTGVFDAYVEKRYDPTELVDELVKKKQNSNIVKQNWKVFMACHNGDLKQFKNLTKKLNKDSLNWIYIDKCVQRTERKNPVLAFLVEKELKYFYDKALVNAVRTRRYCSPVTGQL